MITLKGWITVVIYLEVSEAGQSGPVHETRGYVIRLRSLRSKLTSSGYCQVRDLKDESIPTLYLISVITDELMHWMLSGT